MKSRSRIIDSWNGHNDRTVVFTSENFGASGENECFEWILKNTSFSFHDATTNQGYIVELVDEGQRVSLEEIAEEFMEAQDE